MLANPAGPVSAQGDSSRMIRRSLAPLKARLADLYSPRDDLSRGRLAALGDSLITAFYNVFITGVFYTGFLSIYGISITDMGVVTFVPYLGNLFSIFSPMVLDRFKRKKPVLIGAKLVFYFLFIVATTLMPNLVTDPAARIRWFVGLVFTAHAVYALFSPGFTAWFYRFYPEENDRRMRYIMYNQLFASVTSSLVLIISSVLADALNGSPYQNRLLILLRYLAFALVIADVSVQAQAREFPSAGPIGLRFRDIFTVPLRYPKFMLCTALMFFWNFNANLNNGLWNYHLLNHMRFPYTLINLMTILYTPTFFLLQRYWSRVIRRHSWIRTFGICCLLFVPSEISFFLMTAKTPWLYMPTGLYQHLFSVGLNLSYANILYINLPQRNNAPFIALNTVGCNICAFLGLITGTWISGLSGDATFPFLGLEIYSVQFTTLGRALLMILIGIVLVTQWRRFESDENARLVDEFKPIPRHVHLRLMILSVWRKLRYYAHRMKGGDAS